MSGLNQTTYIDVDSTFRDRQKYPNPADFNVPYSNNRVTNTIDKAHNILSDSYPYYQWQWGCKGVGSDGTGQSTVVSTITGGSLEGTLSEISLSDALTAPTDGSVDSIASNFTTTTKDYFTGLMLTIDEEGGTGKTQKSRIVSHDSVENVVDVSTMFSSGGASDLLLETSNWSITNPSTSSKIFIPGGSSRDGHYVGNYYECLMYGSSDTANPTVHQFKKIISYSGKTRLATLESALSFFDGTNGAANKSGTHSTTYLHRLRKGLPTLPSGSSSAIGTDNIPLVQGTASSGAIARVSLHTAGSGHAVGDVVTIVGGSNGKVLVDAVDGNGGVLKLSLLRGGSGYSTTTGSLQSATSGSGTGLKVNVLGTGTSVNIHNSNGVSTTKGTYTNKLLYYPAFASGGGTANTDPSAAQDFIPQDNTLNVDTPNTAYVDSKHCTFPILAHNYYVTDGINEVIIKSMSAADVALFVANKEFNILDYKEDGVKNIVNYTYKDPNTVSRNLYEINLLNLTLPNSSLRTGPGGFLANHSYIMVEFFSDSHDKTQIYNTNNPNLENVMFKCMVVDVSNPQTIPFVKFKGAYPVVAPFKLNEGVTLRVLMPNGEVFRTTSSDSVPPMAPKKDLQVSATFSVRKIE